MSRLRVDADQYVPFEPRTEGLRALRAELRGGVRGLVAEPGQVLHAKFTGDKPENADVENLLLYNVDMDGGAFAAASREGLRFEYRGPGMGAIYEYDLADRAGTFTAWEVGDPIAEVECPLPQRPRRLDTVWWAIKNGVVRTHQRQPPTRPFTVLCVLSCPEAAGAAVLVKPVFDGVVASLQAHGDQSTLEHVAARVAARLGVPAEAVIAALSDRSTAMLGVVPRLLHPWRDTVQWRPADEACLAGELLIERGPEWRLRATVSRLEARRG